MSRANRDSYIERWKSAGQERLIDSPRGTADKVKVAVQLARVLMDDYGARSVYLFGSLARGDGLHESSDIDLAVEGLPPSQYFQALADLWYLLPPGVELDLVPLEMASPEMLDVVRDEGVPLCAAS